MEGDIAGLSLATNVGGDAIVGGYRDTGVVVSFDAGGNRQWTHTFAGSSREITGVRVVSVDASGAILVAGSDQGATDSASQVPIQGGFIAKLSPGGHPLFITHINGKIPWSSVEITAMATRPSGEVVFSGEFMNQINFGPVSFQANDRAKFVAGISATGEPAWLDPVEAPYGNVDVNALAVAPNGRVYATGQYQGDELSIGGLTFGPTSGTAMFLVELDGRGKATDGRIFDHAGQFSAGRALAVDPMGALLLAGQFVGQIDLDDQTLTSATLGSSFVARLALPFASHRRE